MRENVRELKPPSPQKIYKTVGERKELLKDLFKILRKNYQPEEKPSYSNKSGWTIFFRKSRKALTYINIQEGKFIVTVVIGVSLTDQVESATLSAKTKKMFKDTTG